MCGIFIAFSKNEASLDIDKCRLSLKKMSHRGPDYMFDSLQFNDRLYMGQTILSITGSPDRELINYQVSKNNRFNLVLNGEIYNYKDLAKKYLNSDILSTNTDAEILVNLYEKLSPKKIAGELKGMYAYCVYDRKKQNIYVSRDLIGEKVLYKYEDDDYILWIDNDMVFSAADFDLLYKEDVDVISGLYIMANDKDFAAVEYWDEDHFQKHGSFQFLAKEDIRSRYMPFKVEYVGFGFILFKRGIFEQLQYPWFEPTYLQIKTSRDYSMEDVILIF